jgi:hypothetical protein
MLDSLVRKFRLALMTSGVLIFAGCTTYQMPAPYSLAPSVEGSTITFTSEFPTWTSVGRVVKVEADLCQIQPIGYTKQPGFDRRDLTRRSFGDPEKPNNEVIFRAKVDEEIRLSATTVLAQYDKFISSCGPKFVRFVPKARQSYAVRFVKDGNSCRIEIRSNDELTPFEQFQPELRGRAVVCGVE